MVAPSTPPHRSSNSTSMTARPCVCSAPAGRGRNLGAAAAKFDWLAFTDAGIRLDRDWLEELITRAEQDKTIDVVYGAWEPVTDTFFKKCAAIAYVPPPVVMSDGAVTGSQAP